MIRETLKSGGSRLSVAVLAACYLVACSDAGRSPTDPTRDLNRDTIQKPPPCDNGGNPCPPPQNTSNDTPDFPYEDTCNPAWCTLVTPSDPEFQAILAEANRILAKYASDNTTTGRQCFQLGGAMRDHIGEGQVQKAVYFGSGC